MTYPQGEFPINLSDYHRQKLGEARDFLASIAARHPEWVVRKSRT